MGLESVVVSTPSRDVSDREQLEVLNCRKYPAPVDDRRDTEPDDLTA
jgi:hypothetical protein